ncbi:hypothetical protein LZK73_02875 [Neorhizobium galegae]|nr:hypothetical protein LZK73_02875 [Neorhizobium galegae]
MSNSAVGKRQVFDLGGHVFHAFDGGRILDHEIDADEALEFGMGGADMGEQGAGATADIADAGPGEHGIDAPDAGRRIVRAFMDARMVAVEVRIFLRGQERRPLPKAGEMADMVAPDALGEPEEKRRIPQDRRQQILDDEADAVGGFPVHAALVLRRSGLAGWAVIGAGSAAWALAGRLI